MYLGEEYDMPPYICLNCVCFKFWHVYQLWIYWLGVNTNFNVITHLLSLHWSVCFLPHVVTNSFHVFSVIFIEVWFNPYMVSIHYMKHLITWRWNRIKIRAFDPLLIPCSVTWYLSQLEGSLRMHDRKVTKFNICMGFP